MDPKNVSLVGLRIISPRQTLYQGQVQAVSSVNSSGRFDIIPQHANFITIINNQPITVLEQDGKQKQFNFSQAIIYNRENQVTVYAEPLSAQQAIKFSSI